MDIEQEDYYGPELEDELFEEDVWKSASGIIFLVRSIKKCYHIDWDQHGLSFTDHIRPTVHPQVLEVFDSEDSTEDQLLYLSALTYEEIQKISPTDLEILLLRIKTTKTWEGMPLSAVKKGEGMYLEVLRTTIDQLKTRSKEFEYEKAKNEIQLGDNAEALGANSSLKDPDRIRLFIRLGIFKLLEEKNISENKFAIALVRFGLVEKSEPQIIQGYINKLKNGRLPSTSAHFEATLSEIGLDMSD